MRHHHRHGGPGHPQRRIVLGLCFVVAGVLALLGNLQVIHIGDVSNYWPLIFSVFGLAHLIHRCHVPSMIFGLGFMVLGVGLTLQNLGLVHHVMSLLLPAFLILAGIAVIARGIRPSARLGGNDGQMPPPSDEHDDMVSSSAIMSGASLRCDTQDFKGGELSAIMGAIELDLRQASMQSQAVLRINAVCGGIAIKIPADWQVVLRVSSILGGVDDKSVPPMQPEKTLTLQGGVIMGGIEIKN